MWSPKKAHATSTRKLPLEPRVEIKTMTKVVILCGGLGTRLREETEYRPKPMVDIGGRPILWHIMKMYAHYGFRDFVLCLGYRGNVIKEYFLNYEAMNNDFTITLGDRRRAIKTHGEHQEHDFQVTLADTGADTMTGGRVKRVERFIDDDLFMVTYGDGLADINFQRLFDFHRSHGRLATVTAVHPISRFGVIEPNEDGQVRSFVEKPQTEGWISAGFLVFQRRVFDYLREGDRCVLERDTMARLAAEGQLMTYRHEGFFFAMDTYREYELLNRLWNSDNAPWKVWE
jgi:glucose-1-phosphate cytidylyltransferase